MEKLLLYIIGALTLCAVSSLAGRQYHFIYEKKSWSAAQRHCRETYTDLVTVDDSAVMSALISTADVKQLGSPADAWIGLFDDVSSWRWSLTDKAFYQGYSTDYRGWAAGEPSNSEPGEACAEIFRKVNWNDIPCNILRRPMCVTASGQSATFTLIQSEMTWIEAQNLCRTSYTDLASVRNPEENDRVKAKIPDDKPAWLGLFRDRWKWSNGAKITYTYWKTGQPYGPKENCVVANFGNSGYWEDWNCDSTKAFICHQDPVPFSKHVIKIKLVKNSILDLSDAAVLEDLLMKINLRTADLDGSPETLNLFGSKMISVSEFHPESSVQNDKMDPEKDWDKLGLSLNLKENTDDGVTEQLSGGKLKQKMKDQGGKMEVLLNWRKQPDGKIFFKEKKNQK